MPPRGPRSPGWRRRRPGRATRGSSPHRPRPIRGLPRCSACRPGHLSTSQCWPVPRFPVRSRAASPWILPPSMPDSMPPRRRCRWREPRGAPDLVPEIGFRRSAGFSALLLGFSLELPLLNGRGPAVTAAVAERDAVVADRAELQRATEGEIAGHRRALALLAAEAPRYDARWRDDLDAVVVAETARLELGEGSLYRLFDARRARLAALTEHEAWRENARHHQVRLARLGVGRSMPRRSACRRMCDERSVLRGRGAPRRLRWGCPGCRAGAAAGRRGRSRPGATARAGTGDRHGHTGAGCHPPRHPRHRGHPRPGDGASRVRSSRAGWSACRSCRATMFAPEHRW